MTTSKVQTGVCNVPNRSIFEGDNLDVMRGINDACVDLIYLDPPFNSNRDYAAPIGSEAAGAAFKDTWDKGDVVLDPFCGCATTCIAAERLDRQWIGIDPSVLAVMLAEQRTRDELGLMGGVQAIARSDIPKHTDRDPAAPLSESKVMLYGTQGSNCNGCGTHFLPQHLTVDHIIARSKGGTDHLDNFQLLCGHCNSLKRDHPKEYLLARLVGAD